MTSWTCAAESGGPGGTTVSLTGETPERTERITETRTRFLNTISG